MAQERRKADELSLFIDGASIGNPGPAGIGVVVKDSSGTVLAEISEPVENATANVAEYRALVRALREAKLLGAESVLVHSDSELLVRQCNGRYKVKSPDLRPLFLDALKLCREFEHAYVTHVPRELNAQADKLAMQAAQRAKTVSADAAPRSRRPELVDLGRAGGRAR